MDAALEIENYIETKENSGALLITGQFSKLFFRNLICILTYSIAFIQITIPNPFAKFF